MKSFQHVDVTNIDEATATLSKYGVKASVIAGGTDLLGTLKDEILPTYPEVIVNIKSIPGLSYIKEEGSALKIGALTLLDEIASNQTVKAKYTALAQAAAATASPNIRDMGSIGGNICQLNRCWYFRNPNNRFDCIRKGGNMCYAMAGDNRYHSIFGVVNACVAVNPSDTAPALVALSAKIITTKSTYEAEKFWVAGVPSSTVLTADEVVIEIQIPIPTTGTKSAFVKFAQRKSIDFPVVNCAAAISSTDARICLNAVYPIPYRTTKAEDAIKGKTIDDTTADTAATAGIASAIALANNKYKIQIAKTMVKRVILACK